MKLLDKEALAYMAERVRSAIDAAVKRGVPEAWGFDNAMTQKGNTVTTAFSASSITETIKITATGKTKATRTTTFPTAGTIQTVTRLYNDEGTSLLREVTKVETIGSNNITGVFS